MQLRKPNNRLCPIGCRCRGCRQLPHSGLGLDPRPHPRGGIWPFIFAATLFFWIAIAIALHDGGLI